MISILIPVYNYDVRELVSKLHEETCNISGSEIIVIDDKSNHSFLELNSEIERFTEVKFLKNHQNLGRSKTRNKLAKNAKNSCLIFMDGDTLPINNNFVSEYLTNYSNNTIIFGGISYSENPPFDKKQYLRWFYGKQREEISVSEREKQGNRLFMTGNFCIDKNLFNEVKFNEKITDYGHEDTLFAFEIAQKNIKIQHINNPAFHLGLETGEAFLEKTLIAVKNMHHIKDLGYSSLLETIRLWNVYRKYYFLKPIFKRLFLLTKKIFTKNLTGTKPKLIFFDLYKLFALAYFKK